ncbi:hypothetical protein [Rhodococcus sp. USK13]|uniref:hypothetical protein n=1 Tax=Rhodococcus sp. USK13 TaxID=2806442 RepID=UPI001BCF1E7D|nr:hypothetical protein [Rhodococcus sp. USK13]
MLPNDCNAPDPADLCSRFPRTHSAEELLPLPVKTPIHVSDTARRLAIAPQIGDVLAGRRTVLLDPAADTPAAVPMQRDATDADR